MKMLATIIAVGVGVLLLVFQYILSRKKSVIWGAIIPILTILLTNVC